MILMDHIPGNKCSKKIDISSREKVVKFVTPIFNALKAILFLRAAYCILHMIYEFTDSEAIDNSKVLKVVLQVLIYLYLVPLIYSYT